MPSLRSLLAAALVAAPLAGCATDAPPPAPAPPGVDDFVGSWNIRLTDAEDTFAGAQIDVEKEGEAVSAGLVWRWGSYAPADEARVENGVLHIVRKRTHEEEEVEDVFEARLVDGALKGTATYPDGKTHQFEGRRAPDLATSGEPEWDEPIELFDGKTLEGWRLRDPEGEFRWAVVDGVLAVVEPEGNADLVSDQVFQDMKLHLEFNIAPGSNSGVYLRGRYEVQIVDDPELVADTHGAGALYSRIAPSVDATRPPGEWQTYDITFVGRDLTVVLNGTEILAGTVEGITGGAINPFEGEPGPLMLQGDHGKVRFRNIVVTPAK